MTWTRTKCENWTEYRANNGTYYAHIIRSRKGIISWCVAYMTAAMRHGNASTVADAKAKCEEAMK